MLLKHNDLDLGIRWIKAINFKDEYQNSGRQCGNIFKADIFEVGHFI